MKALAVYFLAFASVTLAQQTSPPSQAADSSKATVYVYRLHATRGAFNKLSIYIDDKELARLGNGNFLGVNLDPGKHVVRSDEKVSAVAVETKPGETYYIRLAFEQTRATFRAETQFVQPEVGWSEMVQTKPNNPKEVKTQDLAIVTSMPPKPAPRAASVGECRSMAVVSAMGLDKQIPPQGQLVKVKRGFKVVDVVNYPGAFVDKWYEEEALNALQSKEGVHVTILEKDYTQEDLAKAHTLCHT